MDHMVIFFHGFLSSPNTDKFQVITHENKVCIPVDYINEDYWEIDKKYHDLVDEAIATGYIPILVGHSLGGYWALRMAERFNVSCVLVNPSLWPTFELINGVDNYDIGTDFRAPKYTYLETADVIIDMPSTIEWAKKHTKVTIYEGGHHRIEKLDTINSLIEEAIQNELVS